MTPNYNPAAFAEIWNQYPIKCSRAYAAHVWDVLIPNRDAIRDIHRALKECMGSHRWYIRLGIPNLGTWLQLWAVGAYDHEEGEGENAEDELRQDND